VRFEIQPQQFPEHDFLIGVQRFFHTGFSFAYFLKNRHMLIRDFPPSLRESGHRGGVMDETCVMTPIQSRRHIPAAAGNIPGDSEEFLPHGVLPVSPGTGIRNLLFRHFSGRSIIRDPG
jgi:hypothetical protein